MSRLNQAPRRSWGYVVGENTRNNPQLVQTGRTQAKRLNNVFVADGQMGTGMRAMHGQPYLMQGDGLMDTISGIVNKGKTLAGKAQSLGTKASDLYTSEIGTTLRNLIPSSDESARPGFAGEKHAILKLANGKYGVANYMGPGTHLEARLKRGDPPRTMADRVAQAHDSRYALARSQKDVANADRVMIAKLRELQKKRLDSNVNIQMGLRPIQAKLHAESLGLVKPGSIATFGDSLKSPNKSLVENKLRELEQEGFGLPGDALRATLIKNRLKKGDKRRKKTGGNAGRGLTLPGGSLKLAGQGLTLPGGQIDINGLVKILSGLVSRKVLPMLLKKLGLPQMGSGKKAINSLLHMRMLRAMNNGASRKTPLTGTRNAIAGRGLDSAKLKSMAQEVAKTLLPILTQMAIRKMSGGRMETISGAQLKSEYENPSLMSRLSKSLASGAFSLFKKFLSSGAKGNGMSGAGFFNDFARGFKKGFLGVMKPALKVAPLLL